MIAKQNTKRHKKIIYSRFFVLKFNSTLALTTIKHEKEIAAIFGVYFDWNMLIIAVMLNSMMYTKDHNEIQPKHTTKNPAISGM